MTFNRTDKHRGKYSNDRKDRKKPYVKQPKGNKVLVIDGNVEQALRKFKKKISNDGLILNIKKNEFYEKPAQKRKIAKAMAIKREKKRQAENNPWPKPQRF
jgi:small subunit ribosomal protein S21